jgi:hypothetical protein
MGYVHKACSRYPDQIRICYRRINVRHAAVVTVNVFSGIEEYLSVDIFDVINIGNIDAYSLPVSSAGEADIDVPDLFDQAVDRLIVFRIFNDNRKRFILNLSLLYPH